MCRVYGTTKPFEPLCCHVFTRAPQDISDNSCYLPPLPMPKTLYLCVKGINDNLVLLWGNLSAPRAPCVLFHEHSVRCLPNHPQDWALGGRQTPFATAPLRGWEGQARWSCMPLRGTIRVGCGYEVRCPLDAGTR